jgi:hypothetical protein
VSTFDICAHFPQSIVRDGIFLMTEIVMVLMGGIELVDIGEVDMVLHGVSVLDGRDECREHGRFTRARKASDSHDESGWPNVFNILHECNNLSAEGDVLADEVVNIEGRADFGKRNN